jgi:hypothetical protein
MAASLFTRVLDRELNKKLLPDNSFATIGKNDNAYINQKYVDLPHQGTLPTVVEDRSSLPATITQRVDTVSQYSTHHLTSDPTLVTDAEEAVVNYQKMNDIRATHGDQLYQELATKLLFKYARGGDSENSWAISPTVVRSTGGTRPVNLPQVGATAPSGNRKRYTLADLLSAKRIGMGQDLIGGEWVGVITPDILEDFMLIEQFGNSDYATSKRLDSGGEFFFNWLGIRWYVRSFVNVFTTGGNLKEKTANTAATDCAGALLANTNYIRRAIGTVKTYFAPDEPEYHGSIVSAGMRYGAIGARPDAKGIINLVEGI